MIEQAVAAGCGFWLLVSVVGSLACVALRRTERVKVLIRRMVPVGVFYCFYWLLVNFALGRAVVARAIVNGEWIAGFERSLHVFVEPWLSHHALPGSDGYYLFGQVVVMVSLLVWCAVVEADDFWLWCRDTLMFICAGGFLLYWFVPTAPPRLLPASYGIAGDHLGGVGSMADQLGAMPSLHTAWAGWAALVLFAIWGNHKWLQWAGWVNFGVTVVVVLTTGNHYVLDVVAGEALTLGGAVVADRLARRRASRAGLSVVLSDGVLTEAL